MDLDDEELKATRILNGSDTREHRVYAIKFAVMQKQIDEKDKRIKELEKNQKQMCEEYCPKSNLYLNSISKQKIKDKIEKEIKHHERNILDIENITMLKSKTAKEEAEIEFNKYAIVVLKKMLQELLEGRK